MVQNEWPFSSTRILPRRLIGRIFSSFKPPGGMTCQIFNCCSEPRRQSDSCTRTNPAKDKGAVLLLASSDVLHAIRSPYVHVVLVDVRSFEQYQGIHIEGAVSFPWGEGDDIEVIRNKPLDTMLVPAYAA
eukprot:760962-Hanusia_phi.AAC.7